MLMPMPSKQQVLAALTTAPHRHDQGREGLAGPIMLHLLMQASAASRGDGPPGGGAPLGGGAAGGGGATRGGRRPAGRALAAGHGHRPAGRAPAGGVHAATTKEQGKRQTRTRQP